MSYEYVYTKLPHQLTPAQKAARTRRLNKLWDKATGGNVRVVDMDAWNDYWALCLCMPREEYDHRMADNNAATDSFIKERRQHEVH